MRQVRTVEELAQLAKRGIKVQSLKVSYLMSPKKAETILKLSTQSIIKIIQQGLYCVGVDDLEPEGGVLSWAKTRIRETGLSHSEIASLLGVSRQSVQKFMNAQSVQTRVIDKYFQVLGL